ncbi:MAG: leucine-rich repeat domain-containing protein [Muribaculaceae bacterium]|nr:leucine-rich repeat domain-containing protein [Muribaculaceae bacterium]
MQQKTTTPWIHSAFTLVLTLLGCLMAYAETPNSDDINDAILVEGSVPVKWTNDATYPWELVDNTMQIPAITEDDKTSTLSCTYTSDYPTEISFSWRRDYYYDSENIQLFVDGELYRTVQTSYWNSIDPFILPAGTHKLDFVDNSGSGTRKKYEGAIRNLRVWACKELESVCLTSKSMPLTFENDPENMWITEDGYIRSNTLGLENNYSTISTTFTVDKLSKFSFQGRVGEDYSNRNTLSISIDSKPYYTISSEDWVYVSVVLEPGEHILEFTEWRSYGYSNYWAQIRNVELHQDWIDVSISTAGSLGREILYKVQKLQDVELLKINGPLNDDDWNVISQLTGVHAVDMSNAKIEVLPDQAFYNKASLSTVVLPEGLKTIGDKAFRGTDAYHYNIPSSVETIGKEAWRGTRLFQINFAENSQLKTIGCGAFYRCSNLEEFIMPNSVTELLTGSIDGSHVRGCHFGECTALKTLHISDGVTEIPREFANSCYSLQNIHLPIGLKTIGEYAFQSASLLHEIEFPKTLETIKNGAFQHSGLQTVILPESVTSLDASVFYDNKSLEYLSLNSHCSWLENHVFYGCTALNTVVCPVATPPTYNTNNTAPFYGVDRGKVKLIVPDFALEDYKQDSYWYNFIVEAGDDASVRDYWYIGNGLTLDKGKRIRNTPEIEMGTGSAIWIDGEAAQPFKSFSYNTSEDAPAVFLSECDGVTATDLTVRFYIDRANQWYFFSPVTDVDVTQISHDATESWVIRRYNGARRASENATSGNWENVTSGKLLRGEGYIVQANRTGWMVFPAAEADHQQFFGAGEATLDINAHECEEAANANWNFLGNPYPTCFDIHDMDMEAPITVWTGSTYKALSVSDDRYVLRPMQSFFVQKPEECTELVMLRDGKQLTTTPSANKIVRRRVPEAGRELLNLSIYAETNSVEEDMTRVVLNENAQLGYETSRDASKFMSMNLDISQIYTFNDEGVQLAINERPYADGNVRLGVYTPVRGGHYVIEPTRMDREAYLYDAVTGLEHALEFGPYTFTAESEGTCNDRFTLRFAPVAANSVEGVENAADCVKAVAGALMITAHEGAAVAVYSVDGTEAAAFTATGGIINVPLNAGVYVVTIDGESITTIVK